MKFFNKLIVLLATATAITGRVVKRQVQLDVNETNLSVTPECQNDLNMSSEYKDCYTPTVTKENYKELCSVLTSQKCQQFYANPMSYLPNCGTSQQIVELLSDAVMKTTVSSVLLICQNDENGNLCPMAESLLDYGKIKDKSIKKTCQSKSCVNQALEMYSSLNNNMDDIQNLSITSGAANADSQNNISIITNYLTSAECKAQADGQKSCATSLKMGSSLFLTFGLLLLSLSF
jgi:hypothetical protein